MATVSITIPDSLVPQAVACFKAMWPDLVGQTDTAVGRTGTARCVRAVILNYQGDVHDAQEIIAKDTYMNSIIALVNQIV